MQKYRLAYLLLFIILIIGAFLRLYRIGDYMGFLGDEGRDALTVKRIIVDHKFTLLGPITSVGLMHLGPFYYYLMIPFLWAFNLDPVGPAVMVALFSLATIFLMWKLGREFFDERVAFIASFLYTLSPLVIIHSHSSWNPNILPFWALLLIYTLLKVIVKKENRWMIVTGLCLGVVIQLHYVALVFFPITLLILVLFRVRLPIWYWLGAIAAGLLIFSPFILFEIRHDFINTNTILQFIFRTGTSKTFGITSPIRNFWDLSVRLFWRLIVLESAEIAIATLLITVGISFWLMSRLKSLIILLLWGAGGIVLLSFYTGSVYDYYLMFAFPLPFLLISIALSQLMQRKIGWLISLLIIAVMSFMYIQKTPILSPSNRLAFQAREIANFILDKTEGMPYNFALIAAGNSDHAYRYYLEIDGHAPIVIENEYVDPERETVQDQLFVVCEEKICQPLGHSLWEIAGYGRAEIEAEWPVGLFKVFKLVPYKGKEE